MADSPQPGESHQRKPYRRAALIVSLAFHVLLIVALAFWYVNRQPQESETPIAQREPVATSASDERTQTPQRERSPDVTSNQVNNTLDRMQQEFESKPEEEQLTALEEKASELEKLASEESVDEISEKFHKWSNTSKRASAPAEEPVDGEFDFDTAQLHDVTKRDLEDGSVKYLTVLVDAHGRTMDVEMTAEEGETAYRTMQTLKRFPLANQVYRQIAMPLIDQAIASQEAKPKPAVTEVEEGEDQRDPFTAAPDEEPSPSSGEPQDAQSPVADESALE